MSVTISSREFNECSMALNFCSDGNRCTSGFLKYRAIQNEPIAPSTSPSHEYTKPNCHLNNAIPTESIIIPGIGGMMSASARTKIKIIGAANGNCCKKLSKKSSIFCRCANLCVQFRKKLPFCVKLRNIIKSTQKFITNNNHWHTLP